jgi:ribonuclease M5
MTERIRILPPVVVEGKYDKIRLSSLLDAQILTTDGFGIFSRRERLALLRALAAPHGLIVLTDSDGAGKQIRAFLSSAIPSDKLFHIYIPRIPGRERRKSAPSKEGMLGVEGMDDALLRGLFAPFAADAPSRARGGVTKADLYALGLTGVPRAAERRDALAGRLGLPESMTPNAFLGAVNILYARGEFLSLAAATEASNTDESNQSVL